MTENSVSVSPRADWLYELKKSYTRPEDLLSALQLDDSAYADDIKARQLFSMRVPRPFVQQMNIGDPNDPLLRQVLPLVDEFRVEPGFHKDPLDEQSSPANGLLHKYHGRVLLILQGGCAVNCRYCFRRHFPYDELTISQRQIDDTLDYIKQNPEVNEVILSGGDPLMAKDERLHKLVQELEALPQLTRLRIHSRLPVVIPSRLTDELLTSLSQSRLQVVLVIHANHANEISNDLSAALKKWHNAGIHVLNQSVLLKGVNDSSDALCRLSETLFRANVLPYYLHQLDKVEGASHFEVSDDKAQQLWLDMTQQLPGFLVPKLVREQARKPSKTAIMPDGLTT
ncbi:EF-P beta-lysylation protein EpmB [Idiomarina sp. WRN-38]|uniref:EF-P beta-lysylation protein EpmB n=1 Tax=Idiomarina sp. OXR-189 TaxID=3100175 RepID=UPI0007334BFA|nr:EF-P beta-lysylation protein EpmB [Idiomarina sp. OXR-189]KTG24451.1 EF-P beta-lysylation protein EpmB [Idiomarina sp. H105]OAE92956.1 EF-P beta-lysylation protein EpmB [Idiomarina sp. WRN-38]WPZ01015.1 EF-P beta-lysylation protein EpmB [Idiomarina sp. OXR-189]|tara:strand:+ start:3677 stop:4699 length:1023 start_codon:yes stop_codon:yes gene_type:complete